jgi:hypothetical protein
MQPRQCSCPLFLTISSAQQTKPSSYGCARPRCQRSGGSLAVFGPRLACRLMLSQKALRPHRRGFEGGIVSALRRSLFFSSSRFRQIPDRRRLSFQCCRLRRHEKHCHQHHKLDWWQECRHYFQTLHFTPLSLSVGLSCRIVSRSWSSLLCTRFSIFG